MKLPDMFGGILQQNKEKKEIFSSIILDVDYVVAALWEMGDKNVPRMLATDAQTVASDDWEVRLDATDAALASIEDQANTTDYSKVVLGMPIPYLTPTGEILPALRPHIKMLTKELELTAIGFVSLHQALMYKLKKEEGVPPSVILLGISHKKVALSLYKVGTLAGQKVIDRTDDLAINVEELLKEFKDLEVLPARILLYGVDGKNLDDLKSDLLRYPWTTRVNFLHFPKIDVVRPESMIDAVSLAGASELSSEMVAEEAVVATSHAEEKSTITAKAAAPSVPLGIQEEIEEPPPSVDEETLSAVAESVEESEDIENEEMEEESITQSKEESDVVVVDPATLGFQRDVDVLEKVPSRTYETARVEDENTGPQREIRGHRGFPTPVSLPKINFAAMIAALPIKGYAPIIVVVLALVGIVAAYMWFVPHVTVTVLEATKDIEESQQITIDPEATSVDAQNKVIPGAKQEKSVDGEKTIPVTGKKNIGDPAKGSLTISNKLFSSQSFSKGTKLTTGTYEFTLDQDVVVASATGTFDGSKYGQADALVTAVQIGPDSNLPANTEFLVKGVSRDDVIAKNSKALTGGTSKQVTVVSRADYDEFLKAISADLVDQAKQQLSVSVGGGQQLIDETIETAVTQKTYAQELDQEAKELSGKATVSVTGISYTQADAKSILMAFIAGEIPQGYTLAEGRTSVTISDAVVKKDGKITAKATIKSSAVPILDIAKIQSNLAGKSLTDAQTYLRAMPGVAAAEFVFKLSGKSRLPMNKNNISVTVAIQ